MKNWKRFWLKCSAALFVIAGVGLLAVFLLWWNPGPAVLRFYQSSSVANGPQIGLIAPDFELFDLEGNSVRLSETSGKPVVINFWATWCTPCVLEMPMIQRYYEAKSGSFEVLAVNADQAENDVRIFAHDIGVTFPVLLDPGGKIQELYRLRGYPTTLFLDAEGKLRSQHIGILDHPQLVTYLEQVGVAE